MHLPETHYARVDDLRIEQLFDQPNMKGRQFERLCQWYLRRARHLLSRAYYPVNLSGSAARPFAPGAAEFGTTPSTMLPSRLAR